MNIGTQLISPNGWSGLVSDRTYYLLASQTHLQRVLLVWFIVNPSTKANNGMIARAYLTSMPRDEFEYGVTHDHVCRALLQRERPPWFDGLGRVHPAALDAEKINKKRNNAQRVADRVSRIQPALDQSDYILRSPNPTRCLNQFARAAGMNGLRFRLWFVTYCLFGRDKWALTPVYHRIGHWDRSKLSVNDPVGRPSRAARRTIARRLSDEDNKLIIQSYRKNRGLGIALARIYRKAVREVWGCRSARAENGVFELYHPDGRRFPTFRQYEYQVEKVIGRSQIQIDRYGAERTRNRLALSRGSYADRTANLMERAEPDAYFSGSYPSGPDGKPLPRLVCVALCDTTSGASVGAGFNLGAEDEDAYRSALFSAAVGLDVYAKLFGLNAGELDTPTAGLMRTGVIDRGSGSGRRIADFMTFRELAPAYSGQGKGVVESSHPRSVHDAEQPSHSVSSLSPVAMAQQELWRAILNNHDSNASARLTPEMAAANVPATPIGIWQYLERRGRSAAHSVPFERAVRELLRPVEFTLTRNGITLHHLRFGSPHLELENHRANMGSSTLHGYVLPMCVRHAWVEIGSELYQLDAQLPFQDADTQLYISLRELQDHGDRIKRYRSQHRDRANAARVYGEAEFRRQTGLAFDESTRRRGRAPAKGFRATTVAKRLQQLT